MILSLDMETIEDYHRFLGVFDKKEYQDIITTLLKLKRELHVLNDKLELENIINRNMN